MHGGPQRRDAPHKYSVSLYTIGSQPQPHLVPRLLPRISWKPLFVFGATSWFHSQQTWPIFEPALNDNHFPQD